MIGSVRLHSPWRIIGVYNGLSNTTLQPEPEKSMARISFNNGDIEIPAELLAEALAMPVAQVQPLLRSGAVTSRYELGTGEDSGRHRLTFFHGSRRLRLIFDSEGRLIQRRTIDFGGLPLPAALRKP
jgi:Family of unknown function (DUF6522)